MRQIGVGVIGTGWCGEIRAVTAANSALVHSVHLAEIRLGRLIRSRAARMQRVQRPTTTSCW